jgi:glycosyltransferase involved in cell wall biosynthesis
MQTMKKISVITPVFNADKHIYCHFKSISQALRGYSFEIIYCDNNSSDKSSTIIKELSNSDSRVVATKCVKRGASAARNTALDCATGDIYVFLDIDDRVLPGGLFEQIEAASNGFPSYSISLVDSNQPTLYPFWRSSKKINFWINFGNQGALSSFVTPKNSQRFNDSINSSEDWLYIVSVRRELKCKIAFIKSVGRLYDATTGYSSSLNNDVIKRNHTIALALHYSIALNEAELLFSLIYENSITFNSLLTLNKVFRSNGCEDSLMFLNLFRILLLKFFNSK